MKTLTPTQRVAVDAVIPKSFWGTHTLPSEWRPFVEAREFARSLGLKSASEWTAAKIDRPRDIPSQPSRIYAEEWVSWSDWFGTEREWRPFVEAREFTHSLGLKGQKEWNAWSRNSRPKDIPSQPSRIYIEWVDWADWLRGDSDGVTKTQCNTPRLFSEAREYARSLRLKNKRAWRALARAGKLPADIPRSPNTIAVYAEEWVSWENWLGKEYVSFEEAQATVRSLGVTTCTEWTKLCASGKRPLNVPSNPSVVYSAQWSGWKEFLGTGTAGYCWLPFEEARAFVRSLNLNYTEWEDWYKSSQRPQDIPTNPRKAYPQEWISYRDWLGITGKKQPTRRT
jgi:hypothetical protein